MMTAEIKMCLNSRQTPACCVLRTETEGSEPLRVSTGARHSSGQYNIRLGAFGELEFLALNPTFAIHLM